MSLLKVVYKPYTKMNDLNRLLDYLNKGCVHEKTDIACWGVNPRDVESMVSSMNFVKQGFEKTEGRQLHHLIISISPRKTMMTDNKVLYAKWVLEDIGNIIKDMGFQWIGVIHVSQIENIFNSGIMEYEDNVHIHLVINSVSFVDGHKFHNLYGFLNTIRIFLKRNYKQLSWEYENHRW